MRTRELNRALLARQLLLERASLPLPEALERVAGIQAQYAPSMYIGLWTRLEGFERSTLTTAIEDRSVVVGTLMRTTIHLVSPADYWRFALATRDVRRAQWLRNTALDDAAMTAAATTLAEALNGAAMKRTDVEALIGKKPGPERLDGDLLDLPGAPRPDAETPAPPRYLPTFDATLLVHARRTQILPEEYRPRIFNTRTPHSAPTFLVDEHVAGRWRYEDGRIVREEFERIDAADRRALDEEGERLATLMAG